MRELFNKWHTDHMANEPGPVSVYHLLNRSTGEQLRTAIHTQPCAMCMAHIATGFYPAKEFIRCRPIDAKPVNARPSFKDRGHKPG